MTDQSLAGKLAVVTGGTRSIGRAVVERFLARGAAVIAAVHVLLRTRCLQVTFHDAEA